MAGQLKPKVKFNDTIKLFSAALIAASTLAMPVVARENCLATRYVSKPSHASASFTARYTRNHVRIPGPRVRANTTAPESKPGGILRRGR
jgi:hypothetical protein